MKLLDKKLVGLLISILFIGLIVQKVNIRESFESLQNLNLKYLLLIIPVYYSAFIVRTLRWRLILADKKVLSLRSLSSSLIIGFMVNALLPARVGEVYRAYIFGQKENISKLKVFASIVLERILDGTTLFFMLLMSIYFVCSKPWLSKLAFSVGILFIGSFIFMIILAKLAKTNKLNLLLDKFPVEKILKNLPEKYQQNIIKVLTKGKEFFDSFVSGLDIFNSFSALLKVSILSFLVWIIEGSVIFLVIKSFGIAIKPIATFFVLGVVSFSTMIPAGPGGFGPYQYAYMKALGFLGVSHEAAFAVAIINQLLVVFLVSLVGMWFMWKDHISMQEINQNLEIENPIPD